MKLPKTIIVIFLFLSAASIAQTTPSRAEELMLQAQKSLEQKEYTQARYFYMQAYRVFATQGNYQKTIECGVHVSALYHRENYYKEAFDLCRAMYVFIADGEQKQQKKLYDLYFYVTKERLHIYTKLKNATQAEAQLNVLVELARQAGSATLNEELLYTQASYYYTFGLSSQGDACFNQLVSQYKQQKKYDKVSQCYKNLISIARQANNAALTEHTYEQFIVWTDSVKAFTAQDELNVLKRNYNESQNTIQEREQTLEAKQLIIVSLCILVTILIAALVLLGLLLLRFIATGRKLKKSIQIAYERNQLKSQFICNISSQMEPTLNTLTASAAEFTGGKSMMLQIDALRKFNNNLQELSVLENSLTECFEMQSINNISSFCEGVAAKINTELSPKVSVSVNSPKLQVKTNPEQLERILMYLLTNAVKYTHEGQIILDIKKRGAHTHQFIVTDTGVGIPAELQENLFKPFAEIKDLTESDGLGLPICALLAAKMNGSLTLDSSYTKGSRFILELRA